MAKTVTLYHVDYYTHERMLAVTGYAPDKIPQLGGAVHATDSWDAIAAGPLYTMAVRQSEICTPETIRHHEFSHPAVYSAGGLAVAGGGGLLSRAVAGNLKTRKRVPARIKAEFFGTVASYLEWLDEPAGVNGGVLPWDYLEISRQQWKWFAERTLAGVALALDGGYRALETWKGQYVILPGNALTRAPGPFENVA